MTLSNEPPAPATGFEPADLHGTALMWTKPLTSAFAAKRRST
jgi:hypothetical protein